MQFKRALLVLIFASFSCVLNAQSKFQSGYYIDNSGNRIEGFILNRDWKNNPNEFRFRETAEDEFKSLTASDVREFGITDVVRYGSFTVDIDRSGNRLAVMSRNREPSFTKETLFLRYAIAGEANLLAYSEPDLIRYFLNKAGKTTQLVYKPYRNTTNKVLYNNDYKFQLLNDLECESIDLARVRSTEYSLKSLSNLFVSYHDCKGVEAVDYRNKKTNDNKFRVSALVGFQSTQMSLKSEVFDEEFDFDSHTGFVFGAEVDYQLPFNYGLFSLVLQPVIQSYQSSEREFNNSRTDVDLTTLMIPILIRRYFPINDKFSMFANAGVVFDFHLSDGFDFEGRSDVVAETNVAGLVFGLGGRLNDKWSLELKRNFDRTVLTNETFATAPFSNTQILLGYTVFSNR